MRKAAPIFLVFLVAAFLLLAHLGAPPLDEAEARGAVVARSMLNTGRLFAPSFVGQSCWGEPLIGFWQSLPFGLVLGLNEFALRLPSALLGLALLFLTYDFARRWFDESTGLLSAGALATTHVFLLAGRSATPDMAGAVVVLLSLWYFARHKSDPGRGWLYGLGVILGLGSGLAGSGAYVMALVCIAALSLARRDFAWVPPVPTLVLALAVSQVAYLALPVAGCIATSSWAPLGASWPGGVVGQFAGTPIRRYTDWTALLYLPWSLLLPIAFVDALLRVRRERGAGLDIIILVGVAALWPSRAECGLVYAAPFASVAVGSLLARLGRGELAKWPSLAIRAVAIAPAGVLLTLVLLASQFQPGVGLMAFGALVAVWSGIRKLPRGMVAAAAIVWLGIVAARTDLSMANWREDAAKVKQLGRPLAFLGRVNAQAAFYLDPPNQVLGAADAARLWAEQTGGILIVSEKPPDTSWQPIAEGHGWRAYEWKPRDQAVSPTRDPAWLAAHPLRGIKSETLTYVFSAEAMVRFNLGTVTMKLSRQDTKDGPQLVLTAESKGGVPGYPMASTITSRLRDSDLGQLEADDLRTKPSYKHRRFVWNAEGLDYSLHAHCRDKACRDPRHMIARRDGTKAHCMDKRCGNLDHYVWRLKQQFRGPQAQNAWHVVAACYVARGFDIKPGAPPQTLCVVNNEAMWELAIRAVEEKAIEVPAGKFDCYKLGFDAKPLNEAARESAGEAEGPFGLTGHVDLYVDKTTKLLVLLDGQIELGATIKVQIQLSSRTAERQ